MVKKLTLAAAALAALATSFMAPVAEASPPAPDGGPRGRLCGYNASSDPAPDAEDDAMTGQVNGGTAVWDRAFTLHCSLQVDDNVHNGISNDVVHEQQPAECTDLDPNDAVPDAVWDELNGVDQLNGLGENFCRATMAPRLINYISPEESQDYLCAWVTYGSPTTTIYYYPGNDGPDTIPETPDDEPGHWSSSSARTCSAATQISTGPVIDLLNDLVFEPTDVITCDVLKTIRPTVNSIDNEIIYIDREGDLFITDTDQGISEDDYRDDMWWDCVKYVDDGDPETIDDEADPAGPGVIDP